MHKPLPQELYRHFKGGRYQVITIAREADTGEEKVVYQALYGDYTVYCRPLSEFVSEVDHEKYPNADQRMRFERFYTDNSEDIHTEKTANNHKQKEIEKTSDKSGDRPDPVKAEKKIDKTEPDAKKSDSRIVVPDFKPAVNAEKKEVKSGVMSRTIEEEAEELGMNPLVVRFLDADSSTERLEVLNLLKPVITNDMIDIMALAIDTEISGNDPDVRCGELRECLLTKQRFEVTRLRR